MINLMALCKAMGIPNVMEIDAFDLVAMAAAVKEAVVKDEITVIIAKSPCVLLDKRKRIPYIALADKCRKCGMCLKPGCPAMSKNADGTIHIDDTLCTGCGLCQDLCKFSAIRKAGE